MDLRYILIWKNHPGAIGNLKKNLPILDSMLRNLRSALFLFFLKFADPQANRIIRRILQNRLSYLSASELYDVWKRVCEVERLNLDGVLIEAGCALGGSGIAICASKDVSRPLFIFDTFEMIPPPSDHDGPDAHERYQEIIEGRSEGIKGDMYYGYQTDLFNKVRKNFERFGFELEAYNTRLLKGHFEETLVLSQPVAFTHIDSDWYESVKICLERIEPFLVSQGVFVIDDYFLWSGCRKAVDEFFCDKMDAFIFEKRSALHIIKR
jgi:O-methyltransferase